MKRSKISVIALPLLLAGLSSCSLGGGSKKDNGTVTTIIVQNYNGGVGELWLSKAIEEFKELTKNKSYENGKTGVEIQIIPNIPIDEAQLDKKTYHICFNESGVPVRNLASSGYLTDIGDVINGKALTPKDGELVEEDKTILSKIDTDYLDALKGDNGNYYALPHYEWYPGLTYDIETFDDRCYYFAAHDVESSDKEAFNSKYAEYTSYFINDLDVKKSCGPDGVYDTEDDGLPSSLQELLIVCDKMTNDGVCPFSLAGNHKDYSHYLLEGLVASLGGKDSAKTFYTFNGQQNIVARGDAGYKSEKLWGGLTPDINYSKENITEQNGYKTRETAERYYAIALLNEIVNNPQFLDADSKSSGADNVRAQRNFIMSNFKGTQQYGFLFEGSYWFNEAQDLFKEFYTSTGRNPVTQERKVGWLPLPVQVNGQVQEGDGKSSALLDIGYSFGYITNCRAIQKSEGLKNACKDFMRFLYSDYQLCQFTETSGSFKAALTYTPDISKLTTAQRQVLALKNSPDSGVIYGSSNANVFIKNRQSLLLHNESNIWRPYPNQWNDMFQPLQNRAHSVRDCFEHTFIESDWGAMLAK